MGRVNLIKKKSICISKSKRKISKIKNKNVKKKKRKLTSERKYQLQKLRFRAWKSDKTQINILKKRGWHYVGEPLKKGRYDYPKCMFAARKKNKLEKKDCLILGDDDDGNVFAGYSDRVVCSVIPGSHNAENKVQQQKMFENHKFFPNCYTLPKELKLLKAEIKNANEDTFWICKPANSCGGLGLTVYNGKSKELRKLFKRKSPFVVQRYISDPYLMVDLYKFHIRCYMLISHVSPLKAYLYKDGQVLFSTVPFDLKKVGNKFDKYIHLTNYKISNEKKNHKNMFANKQGIGIGTEWTSREFFDYLNKNDPAWSENKFWNDLIKISKTISHKIVSNSLVKKEMKNANVENHYELFGLDVMMNKNFELFISEFNTQPSMDQLKETMDNGVINPHNIASNKIALGVVNDVMTKMGFDSIKKFKGTWMPLH